jgi:hypothetical protein
MDDVVGVLDGSCTQCDGADKSNCAAATCADGYENFQDGVGCTGASISDALLASMLPSQLALVAAMCPH